MDLFEILTFPFMQRSLLAGALAAIVCSVIGMLTVLRGSSLYGDALAHSSLAGVATALLLGFNPVIGALVYAITISIGLTAVKDNYQVSLENLIALILPVSMGLSVILLSFFSGYQPELMSFLFGSILGVSWTDVTLLLIISVLVLGIFYWKQNELLFVFFDEQYAKITGLNVKRLNIIYNVLLAMTVVTAIQIVGVILVNALLIVPTTIVRMFAVSLKSLLIITPIVSLIITLTGIWGSFVFDVPTGPCIAVTAGILFGISLIIKRIFR